MQPPLESGPRPALQGAEAWFHGRVHGNSREARVLPCSLHLGTTALHTVTPLRSPSTPRSPQALGCAWLTGTTAAWAQGQSFQEGGKRGAGMPVGGGGEGWGALTGRFSLIASTGW